MTGSIGPRSRTDRGRFVWSPFLLCLLCACYAGSISAQTLKGFVLTGDPASTNGATWTYRDTVEGIIYDLTGVLFKPGGTSKFPAVVLSHGHDSNVNIFTAPVAKVMRPWGLVCIGTNYTHAAGVPAGSPGDSTQPGASTANILRARKCIDILYALGYVDTTRIAAHGYSMGAFVTAALVGTYPGLFRVASHGGGGVNDARLAWTKTAQAEGITVPYQIHHAGADSTVPLADDLRLDSLLQARGVQQQFYIYPGYSHGELSQDTTMLKRVHTWYTAHGLFPAAATDERDQGLPASFALSQNYPNPFNPTTTISYSLPAAVHVTLKVFDVLGREVATLVDGNQHAGANSLKFDASRLSSGVYYYRIVAGSFTGSRQMLLLR
jgi:dienelactone hydrolase